MAVLSIFDAASRAPSRATSRATKADAGAPGAARARAERGVRRGDLGTLSRERRLALYLGACTALGLDAAEQPLRFVRCNDGRLRLFDPRRRGGALSRVDAAATVTARLERELAAAAAAIERGGGISYDIDLLSGDLRVREVVRAARRVQPAAPPSAAQGRRRRASNLYLSLRDSTR